MANSKNKTTFSILRKHLGKVNGSLRSLCKITGFSESFLKKVSCGIIELNERSALVISSKTGISASWLLENDIKKTPVDVNGNTFTEKSFSNCLKANIKDIYEITERIISLSEKAHIKGKYQEFAFSVDFELNKIINKLKI
jgi:hypothetical protein